MTTYFDSSLTTGEVAHIKYLIQSGTIQRPDWVYGTQIEDFTQGTPIVRPVFEVVYDTYDWDEETGNYEVSHETIYLPRVEAEAEADPEYPNRKQRRSARRKQNAKHKKADRAHGKKRPMSRKDRMRAENDRAQQERPVGMWHENCKGKWTFRPFQRTNRHNTYLSPEQDRLNALNVSGHNVTVSDIQWAKKKCRDAALDTPFMFADSVWTDLREDLKWLLAQTETLEQEIALITVIKTARWREVGYPNPDGRYFDYWVEIDLPSNKKCFASIEAKEYLPLCKKHDLGLVIEEYNPKKAR